MASEAAGVGGEGGVGGAGETGGAGRATLSAAALRALAARDPSLAKALGMGKKGGKPKSFLSKGPVYKESGSPFDQTRCLGATVLAPGQQAVREGEDARVDEMAFRSGATTGRKDPKHFLTRGSGFGGNATTLTATLSPSSASSPPPSSPPRAGARGKRSNPPNSMLRTYYERGDLPVQIDQRGVRNQLRWTAPMEELNLSIILPTFFDGLREEEHPFAFVAETGVRDLLNAVGYKVADILPTLVMPIRSALVTRRRKVMARTLRALQHLAVCDLDAEGNGRVGRELVPFYRQLLPVLNIFVNDNLNLGDGIHYGQRKGEVVGDLITETLQILESVGGPAAALNIIYYIPTYAPLGPTSAPPHPTHTTHATSSASPKDASPGKYAEVGTGEMSGAGEMGGGVEEGKVEEGGGGGEEGSGEDGGGDGAGFAPDAPEDTA